MCRLVRFRGARAHAKASTPLTYLRPRALATNNRTSALQDGRAVREDPGKNPRGKPNPRIPSATILASPTTLPCPVVRSRPNLPTCPHTSHASRQLASQIRSLHRGCDVARKASALQRQQPSDLLRRRQAKEAPKPSSCYTVGSSALQCLHVESEPSRKQTGCRSLDHRWLLCVLSIAAGSNPSKTAGRGVQRSRCRNCEKGSELRVSTKLPRGDCKAVHLERSTRLLRS